MIILSVLLPLPGSFYVSYLSNTTTVADLCQQLDWFNLATSSS